ncbi:DUF1254 domain-containing protein [Ochrobactrum vermis]|uniref:DUF1254 domain-containing protein n=1 Tax=Ochrobactrum vermis TaxID=1827297 RepID=A0ABU8PDK5_9HYPH|nr:DUF1254 domain-containing protein [Ochrobactrum vermis]PQZ31352.1 hypothetical protein CQZ93_10420 [Ochrobactrum vermis]
MRFLVFLFLLFAGSVGWAASDTPDQLAQRDLERKAVSAVIWGMPAVNYDLMRQEMLTTTDARVNQVLYWGHPLDWHNQTLTPNPDALYFMVFYDTREVGPVVIDVPTANGGSFNGNIVDIWQMPLEDVGLLGADKGKGGKYLLLPPDYEKPVPEGFIPLRSNSFGGYALLRSNLPSHSDEDVAKSVEYGRKLRIYPLSRADNPPETVFVDAKDVLFDTTIRYDASFFDNLNRIVQEEPWLDRDRLMIDPLRTIGIEKGKAYTPTGQTRQVLDAAVKEAHATLAARYDAGLPAFWDGSHWAAPAFPELVKAAQASFNDPNAYPVDARGLTYTYGYIGIKHLGTGQMYLISIKDKNGENFDGGKTYRLTVPPKPPVQQYWSVTVYDRDTHALVKNMARASRSSQIADLQKNPDGFVDIFFGPAAPQGKESNWVPTDPQRGFELMFRLYAPTKALFEKAWVLPDVEKIE